MDEKLRGLKRAWQESGDPVVGARLLHQRRLTAAEVLRDELFEHPEVRRVYASSLPAEDPLRDFLSLQLVLEGDESLGVEKRSRLTRRECELLEQHGREWTGPRATSSRFMCRETGEYRVSFSPVLGDEDHWVLRGGRATQLPWRVLARDLIERGGAALGPGPVPPVCIEGLYEVAAFEIHPDPSLPPLRRERNARRLREYAEMSLRNLTERYGPEELSERLARSEVLERLHDVDIWSYNLGNAHTQLLLESPFLRNLRRLELTSLRQTSEAFAPLARDRRFERVERLCFKRLDDQDGTSDLGPELAVMLGRADHLGSLESLAIPFASLGARGVLELVRAPALPRLRHLDVSENMILEEDGVAELVREPGLARLRSLDLSYTAPARALGALLGAGSLQDVERLGIACGALDDESGRVPRLPATIDLPRLRSLRLDMWDLRGDTVSGLGSARFPALRALSLAHSRLDDESFATLVRSPLFRSVEELDIFGTDVGDRGLEGLAASPWGPRLRRLKLGSFGDTPIPVRGMAALARSQQASTLNEIDFAETCDEATLCAVARELVAAPGLDRITTIVVRQRSALELLRSRWGPFVIGRIDDEL